MGCDIKMLVQRKTATGWETIPEFDCWDDRNYAVFGFLVGVHNYSDVPPLSEPRGLPDNIQAEDDDVWLGEHSFSWLLASELTNFDYDQPVEDRRIKVQIGPNLWTGRGTAEPGGGKMTTWREFLGSRFMAFVDRLRGDNEYRIVFGFNS
ncbi:unnamed protein product [Sphagnum jensenii]